MSLIDDVSLEGLPAGSLLRRLEESNRQLDQANRRLRAELASAARVQQALLPPSHFSVPGFDVSWRLKPCDDLGGDLLNCLRLDEHHMAFYVLDVSGHGVTSALLAVQVARLMSPLMSDSIILKEPLKEHPWYRVVEPRRVLERLNSLFQMRPELTQYFTMLYGILDCRTRQVDFASAGHPGPIHGPAGSPAHAMRCAAHPVGLFEHACFAEGSLTLEPGDRLWAFSDGLTDVVDAEEREFGTEALVNCADEQRNLPLGEAVDGILHSVNQWCRPQSPDDDCTLLAIEARAEP